MVQFALINVRLSHSGRRDRVTDRLTGRNLIEKTKLADAVSLQNSKNHTIKRTIILLSSQSDLFSFPKCIQKRRKADKRSINKKINEEIHLVY